MRKMEIEFKGSPEILHERVERLRKGANLLVKVKRVADLGGGERHYRLWLTSRPKVA